MSQSSSLSAALGKCDFTALDLATFKVAVSEVYFSQGIGAG